MTEPESQRWHERPSGDAELLERLLVNLRRHGSETRESDLQSRIAHILDQGRAIESMPVAERAVLLFEIKRMCHIEDLPDVLSLSGVPVVYNFQREFEANVAGPWDRYPDSDGVTRGHRWSLMGFDIGYPIGIPASALTVNSKYVDYYARRGFNVLTYKSVRSREWRAHDFPNWVYLKGLSTPIPLQEEPPGGPVLGDETTFLEDEKAFSTANSFGVPSEAPEVWKKDVAAALRRLGDGKLLIVSVMGSSEREDLRDAVKLAEDFVEVACHAEEAGAPAVELNLSCPNTLDPSTNHIMPAVCLDPVLTGLIVERVANALSPKTRLVAKLSWMAHDRLGRVLERIANYVDCVSGINTLPMSVLNRDGRPTFGTRPVAGVSGVAIRNYALDFVASVTNLRDSNGWSFDVIGMGGVMNADDVREFFRSGADAVQTATAAEDDPTLPYALLGDVNGEVTAITRAVFGVVKERPGADIARLASATSLPPSAVRAGIIELKRRGVIREVSQLRGVGYEVDARAVESAPR